MARKSGEDNVLRGGAGNDLLTGSAAADFFVFGDEVDLEEVANGVREVDTIFNYSFEQGDAIDLTNGLADIASWMVVAGNTQLTLVGDGDVIVLRNVVIDDLATDLLIV